MKNDDASGFVIVSDVIPDAILDIRYYTTFNFTGERVDGYEEPLALLTKEAAEALKKANEKAISLGYRLKIFDCYRPQMAVDHFIRWAEQHKDVAMKNYFYPGVDKENLFDLGFVAAKSGHSRGSTVDLTLFDMSTQKDIDVGGTFDYFGKLSWAENTDGITDEQAKNRKLLRDIMLSSGFKPLAEEWWHFTLENEPYPDTYFTFPVNSDQINRPRLDRGKYEKDLKAAKEAQLKDLALRIAEVLDVNENIHDQPITNIPDQLLLDEIQDIEIPRTGRDAEEVADELVDKVFKTSLLTQHPRFFSFVASGVSPYSIAGSVLSDIYNINSCGYETAPAIALIEEKLIKWMGSRAGFGDECGGVFTSGGSLSNLTGMIAARGKKLTEDEYQSGTAYISDQAHSSVKKGLRLMGIRSDNVIIIPSDDAFKMRTDLLEAAIKSDIVKGKKPFLVIGTLGTTNTGSIDPLEEIAEIAKTYDMWLHVDGAFGGSILFSDIYNHLAKGIEQADSLSWDTHKWAMQVYSCSCIIAKNKKDLINVFAEHPEYLEDVIDSEHTDSWDLGIEMSRPARAIKLWYTVQAMGTDLLADVIDYPFFYASLVKKELSKLDDWEITSPPMCGTITFRYAPKGLTDRELDALNGAISKQIISENFAYIVTTTIKNKRVLRMNMINCNTTDDDVLSTVKRLDEIAQHIYKCN